ncbi:hypothetical protein [Solitalea koreensis]|nr:hypothetical protein [Solitalea koreensis]
MPSCKKDDTTPQRTELQKSLKGQWNVDSIEFKYYENNVINTDYSGVQPYAAGDLIIEFVDGGFIATNKGYQPQKFPITENEDGNSFNYADSNGRYTAVISVNGAQMTWVETSTGVSNGVNLKQIVTIYLTKL